MHTEDGHLGDLRPDPQNAKIHNERNLAAIEHSVQTNGFGRPMLAAADGTVLAGNATLEVVGALGMERAIRVYSDGTQPIIHVRTDLKDASSDMARRLAFADNRTAELASGYDPTILAELMADGLVPDVQMTKAEAAAIMGQASADDTSQDDEVPAGRQIECPECGHRFTS